MRTFLAVTVTLLLSSALLFLTTVETTTSNRSEKHLKVSFGGSPHTLDPAQVNGMLESRILLSLYEGLTRLDPETLEPKPGVARDWDVSDNKKRWTFYFRRGDRAARWSNGKKVTPEHFEFAWKRVLTPNPPSPYAQQLYRYIKNAGRYYFSDPLSELSADRLKINFAENPESDIETLLKKYNRIKSYGTRKHLDKLSIFSKQFERITSSPSGDQIASELQRKVSKALNTLSSLKNDLQNRPPVSWEDVGIETGTHRLTVTLKNPTPHFKSLAAFMTYYPVYPPLIKRFPSSTDANKNTPLVGDETRWTKPGNLVTNGPFKLTRWVFSDRMTMRANPYYWEKNRPHVDRLTFYVIENDMTGLNMFKWGDLHLTTEVPNRLKKELQEKPYYHEWIRFNTECVRFNVKREPFDDPRVRKAFAMAIDRSKLTNKITRGKEVPTTRWVPDSERWYDPPKGIGFQPERARELLAEAGYPNGEGLDNIGLLITDRTDEQSMFVGIQSMLNKHLNVQIKARKKEWSVYLSAMMNKNYDMCLSGWIGDYYDPMTFLDMFITGGKNNRTNWGREKYDRLIEQASRAADPERRYTLLRKAEKMLIRQELPFTPLYHPTNTAFWHPDKLDGVYKNSIGVVDPKYIKMTDEPDDSTGR